MKTNNMLLCTARLIVNQTFESSEQSLLDYYEKAGPDYETWSPNFNMHFGYFEKGMNPLNRERMLENMNSQVLKRLSIDQSNATMVDMGCGLGAAMRYAGKQHENLNCVGVTLVPWQKEQAEIINKRVGLNNRIEVLIQDYTDTSIPSGSVDHVIAMESSCYAGGSDKKDLLREIYRILKPGGTFVVADGFLKGDLRMSGFLKSCYDQLCKSWALKQLGKIEHFTTALQTLNFNQIKVEDISWKVAPSVAHVPHTVLYFLFRQLFSKEPMSKERWDNLKSPLLTMVLGLHRRHFGYYLISGKKGLR